MNLVLAMLNLASENVNYVQYTIVNTRMKFQRETSARDINVIT